MDGVNKVTPLVARILMSLIFIMAGFSKLTAAAATAGYFEALGIPVPGLSVYLVGLFEVIAGLAVLVGFKARIAALLLAVFCVASGFMAHFQPADQAQMTSFMKNLAMAGGYLYIWLHGPGAFAVDKD
ncbi:DoxX family protein [Maritalea mediterranea]|uniref:DoxX family protein n=1 Tax=Maritalea mediterranea TaxID=2909667 RepID=A0ABS9E8H2_9HYPH|nr:DoxX family protein [Maritalea mediterranea]MCF4097756.1 DoxX family protein [Maritalea mediterranea]